MTMPQLEPPVADAPPCSDTLTDCDRLHLVTHLRLLDAEADGALAISGQRLIFSIRVQPEDVRERRHHDHTRLAC